MRVFGILGLVVILAFLMLQYKSRVTSVGKQHQQQSSTLSESVENDVNNSVSGFQKKLDDAMKQSGE